MRATKIVTAMALCVGLAACGDTIGEQALFGAGGGFLGAAVVGGDPVLGALVGATANVLYCEAGPGNCN